MNEIIIATIQHLIGPALLAGVGYIIKLLQDNKKTANANAQGTMLLLRRQIIYCHKKHCIQGEEMTPFCFEDIKEIHDTYKALGGNGLTDKMWDEIEALRLDKPQNFNVSEV